MSGDDGLPKIPLDVPDFIPEIPDVMSRSPPVAGPVPPSSLIIPAAALPRPIPLRPSPTSPPPVRKPPGIIPIPIASIKREETVAISDRPASPRDSTKITVQGHTLDRDSVQPIVADEIIRPASPVASVTVPNTGTVRGRQVLPVTSQPQPKIVQPPIRNAAGIRMPVPRNKNSEPSTGTFGPRTPAAPTASVRTAPPAPVPAPVPAVPRAASPIRQSVPVPPNKVTASTTMVSVPAPPMPALNTPNYAAMSPELQAQHRAQFIGQFGILRNAWPNYHIPEITNEMSLSEIHAQYTIYLRHIHVTHGVDQYKVYMVIMWLIVEAVLTKMGLPIGGYTVMQLKSMNKYDQLLIELGETNYKSNGSVSIMQSNWPVEARLFFMALLNAVAFIIIKMLSNVIGEGAAVPIIEGLMSFIAGTPPQPGQTLFGGPGASANPNQLPGPLPSLTPPNPMAGTPMAGMDLASLIGSLGSMFLNGGRPNAAPAAAPTSASAPAASGNSAQRFAPAYEE
jgi:hypothetical protein